MIKATIQNNPYCTEIRFPCSETELSKKLGELGMNTEHLAPVGTVIEIEPTELSMLMDCEVSLDALNFLGKRMDGMDKSERNHFLAVLTCDELVEGYGLKDVINLTFNIARYTLIGDTDDLEEIGLTHMLNVHLCLTESEYTNKEWLIEEGKKLLESGSGIDTEYGKIYFNDFVDYEEVFNGTTIPAYYCEPNSLASVEISYCDLIELVELPCEDIAIKKALFRLGADSIKDCKIMVDLNQDFSKELTEKISEAEKAKDLFGLNDAVKQEYNRIMQEKPETIFKREVSRALGAAGFTVSENNGCLTVFSDGKEIMGIYDNGMMSLPDGTSDDAYFEVKSIACTVSEYCSAYENAPPLKATDLSGNYRSLAEFNGTVFAVKNTEYGFEFVTWDRTYDGNAVYHGNYYKDYEAAKENFAIRSELIDKDKLFSVEELKSIHDCVDFTVSHNDDLSINECESLEKLSVKISENIPEQQQSDSPEMSM